MRLLTLASVCAVWVCVRGCRLEPETPGAAAAPAPKSPGDNHYRLVVNGDIERYLPGQRYVVTLVGARTHDVVQQFTRFKVTLEPLDPAGERAPRRQGQFQLFADTLTAFHEECLNTVKEADDLPKTEVQVMWKAPSAGSGCVLIKAMVMEPAGRWFAEDGQLTRRVCEDAAASAPGCCACDDAKYKVVFEGLWSAQTHPKDFPVKALWLTHFSDVIGATHSRNFSFWGEGQIATDGFRSLAEWGSVGLLERELRQKGRELRSIVKAAGLWHPHVNGNTSSSFTADRRRHVLSLASMFGPSPDWVVGVNGLDLCKKDCSWIESKVVDLYPYDAGTDNGISYMSPNSETIPREKMYRITTMYPEDPRAPFYNPDVKEMAPMARLYLQREKLIARSCDEETLQQLVTEIQENSQSADKPECAVSAWSAWSACSVTCGKGLRMRSRQYRMPDKAQMFACDRQLVSKEMCVAEVPECQEDNSPAEEGNSLDGELGSNDEVCRTAEWGPWSECSVTCGVGVSTRRRQFLNHMGLKKCPLVQVEENRKCMEPPCTEQETEISDPSCPTIDWSPWSPCSASCGRGVRIRTRLLLVPPEQQQQCSARVELLQQRPCRERDDCTVDMQTAKRICMEEADQGPCRGVYQRWAFAAQKGMCAPFLYGGCRGNRNNFLTREDCSATCQVVLDALSAGGGANSAVAEPLSPPAAPAAPAVRSNYPGLSVSSATRLPSPPALTAQGGASSLDCVVSAWGPWSACSVSCGTGYQERTRTILSPGQAGGAPCPPRTARRRRCTRHC